MHRSGNITRNIENHIRRLPIAILALSLALALAAPAVAAADLAAHVNPFAGTRPGPGTFGGGHNFPGATLVLLRIGTTPTALLCQPARLDQPAG